MTVSETPEGVATEGHPYNDFEHRAFVVGVVTPSWNPIGQTPLEVVVGVALRGHPFVGSPDPT